MPQQNASVLQLSKPLKIIVSGVLLFVSFTATFACVYRWHINVTGGPLFHAVEDGDTAQALTLLDSGNNPDQSSDLERNRTPLMIASSQGHIAIVRALIAHHANVNAEDDHGNSVLSWAERSGEQPNQNEIIALLKHAGAHK